MAAIETFADPCGSVYQISSSYNTTPSPSKIAYQTLTPYAFRNLLVDAALKVGGEEKLVNASRGNPNFFSSIPRSLFAYLSLVAVQLGGSPIEGVGVVPQKEGISKRFYHLVSRLVGVADAKQIKHLLSHMQETSKLCGDDFIHSLVVCLLGCEYPTPRVQPLVHPILADFLAKRVYHTHTDFSSQVDLMPTEGATSAILYILNSLQYNMLLVPGDTIAVVTPVYTPYLEIPHLARYNLQHVCIRVDAERPWVIPDNELAKLADRRIKALLLVNPTNPNSYSLSLETVQKLATVVKTQNPELLIIEDSTYAPLVEEFASCFTSISSNTIGIFSFSKYFGTTGWHLGLIAMHKSNIIDEYLLRRLATLGKNGQAMAQQVHGRYAMLTPEPETVAFIDRVLADSKEVMQAHTASLSTPQQALMSLFAAYDLMDKTNQYNQAIKAILAERQAQLLAPLEFKVRPSSLSADYYISLDIRKLADNFTNDVQFGNFLDQFQNPYDFVVRLAEDYGIVVLPSMAFSGPFWGVRISLSCLTIDKYAYIGASLRDLLEKYYVSYKECARGTSAMVLPV